MKLYMTTNPFTLTNINTKEVQKFGSLDELLDTAFKRSNEIYIFEFNKLCRVIGKKLALRGFECIQIKETGSEKEWANKKAGKRSNAGTPMGTLPVGKYIVVANKNDATAIRLKVADRINITFLNASKKFCKTTVQDICNKVGEKEENLGLAKALKNLFDKGFTGWTISSDTKKSMIKSCFPKLGKDGKDISYEKVKDYLPILPKEVHDFCMKGFQGGICHFNPKYKGKTINKKGIQVDVNSLYPSIMEQEELPYGKAVKFEGLYQFDSYRPLFIQMVKIDRLTVKPGKVPCFKKQGLLETEPYIDEKDVTLILTNPDIDNLFQNYDVEGFEGLYGYKFMTSKGFYDAHISFWKEAKVKAKTAFDRMTAKMMLNSTFGKFAIDTGKKSIIYTTNSLGQFSAMPDTDSVSPQTFYAPVGLFVTAYGRKRLLNAIEANEDNFVYSDTDSMYILGKKAKGIEIHESKFGAWKKEFSFKRMYIVGKKQYIAEKTDGTLKVACAGMPEETMAEIKNFEDFQIGKKFTYPVTIFDNEGIDHKVYKDYVLQEGCTIQD